MSLKRRLGEGDDCPSIAAAAFTVTVSNSAEASKAAPTYSGYNAEAPQQSVAQESEPEVDPTALFAHALREAMQGVQPLPRPLPPTAAANSS